MVDLTKLVKCVDSNKCGIVDCPHYVEHLPVGLVDPTEYRDYVYSEKTEYCLTAASHCTYENKDEICVYADGSAIEYDGDSLVADLDNMLVGATAALDGQVLNALTCIESFVAGTAVAQGMATTVLNNKDEHVLSVSQGTLDKAALLSLHIEYKCKI